MGDSTARNVLFYLRSTKTEVNPLVLSFVRIWFKTIAMFIEDEVSRVRLLS